MGQPMVQQGQVVEVYDGLMTRELVDIDTEISSAQLKWVPSKVCANPFGMVQGGLVSTILDETAVIAGNVLTGGRFLFPALSFTVDFLKPVPCAPIVCVGQLMQQGRSTAFLEARIIGDPDGEDANGGILAKMSLVSKPFALE